MEKPSIGFYVLCTSVLLAFMGARFSKKPNQEILLKYKLNKYQIDLIYEAKKDSLENVYQLQIDSLKKDHQNNLKNLENKFNN
ncbi:MAG: hypothetical protein AABY32_03610 [Nanoarchaeota archaeon]